jgi:hypothetical protein
MAALPVRCADPACKNIAPTRYARHQFREAAAMGSVLSTYAVPFAVGAVAVVLLLGLVNMMRGGSPDTSQRLMRLRVLLQFVAVVVIMITIWAMGR